MSRRGVTPDQLWEERKEAVQLAGFRASSISFFPFSFGKVESVIEALILPIAFGINRFHALF